MKVIGAGFPRTGTTSMKEALERLGFGPCYHMFEIFMNPDHVQRWLPVATGDADWGRVFEGYHSTQDWPASHFWRELADAYPEAKVILTVREPSPWYRSFKALMQPEEGAERQPPPAIQQLRPVLEQIGQSHFGDAWRIGESMPDEEIAVQAFHRHVATVKESIAPQRLLVFDVREGWEPLCSFLGVEVPDEPFPHLNDAEWIQRAMERLRAEGTMPSPFQQRR
jgi:hypothetical protein